MSSPTLVISATIAPLVASNVAAVAFQSAKYVVHAVIVAKSPSDTKFVIPVGSSTTLIYFISFAALPEESSNV